MKFTKTSLIPFLLLALPLTAGCRTRSLHEAADRATNTPYSASSHATRTPAVENVTMGKKVNSDGAIASDDQANKFQPGDPIYVTMQVGGDLAGAPVQVTWYTPDNQPAGQDQKTVKRHEKNVSFQAQNAASWAPGDYHVEISVNGQRVATQQFTIADRNS